MSTQIQSKTTATAYRVLVALSLSHCLNDLLQSAVSASYPIYKEDFSLSFTQIGLITLVYQIAASVFQPVFGLYFDKRPFVWSLPMGMTFTLCGIALLAFAPGLDAILSAVFLIGIGSSVLHPEASRITSLASGGRRGLAQSMFQVGGNFGGSVALLVALIVAPFGHEYLAVFALVAMAAIGVMTRVCRWYRGYLNETHSSSVSGSIPLKRPLPLGTTLWTIFILMLLIFSKYIYMASLSSYYTFYLIEKFGVSIQASQLYLFVFLVATAAGTLVGGPVGDRIGRKYVIWISILGTAPFSLLMPHAGLGATVVLSFCVGFMLSSAFPAILLYAQELLPAKLGLVSGLFFGFAFGVAGIASAILGDMADAYGLEAVYAACAYMPLLGLVACFLPNLNKISKQNE